MKIPKWLDSLLDVEDNESAGRQKKEEKPVSDPVADVEEHVPKDKPKKKKKKKRGLVGFLKNMSRTNLIFLTIGVISLIVCIITMPSMSSNHNSSGNSTSFNHKMDDVISLGGMEFTIKDYTFDSAFIGDTKSKIKCAAGNTFAIVELDVKNIGKSNAKLFVTDGWNSQARYSYSLVYANGYEYRTTVQGGNQYLLENYESTIIPLQSVTRYVCFEVPEEIVNSEQPLAFRVYYGSYVVTWYMRGDPPEG